ncbi:MAG: hypothetical protein HC886_21160 [Leptolyngbyaceae cyanobacterium SM1_1_3]|nr:hypothetical protein [Leptolyngbyaceae cyanobacterium SM1_1_3]
MTTDILILTVYFICVAYVLYQIALAQEAQRDDQVDIHLNQEALMAQLAAQLQQQGRAEAFAAEVLPSGDKPLDGSPFLRLQLPNPRQPEADVETIDMQVLPQGMRPLQPPIKALDVRILNRSQTIQVYIDWDRSSITRLNNQAQRVIRLSNTMPNELFQPQVQSVINPGQLFSVAVTSESAFGRSGEAQSLEPQGPLIDLEKAIKLPQPLQIYSLKLLVWRQACDRP